MTTKVECRWALLQDTLTSVKITKSQAENSLQCPVCLTSFGVDEDARMLPCSHVYHEACIYPWLDLKSTCPVCRRDLLPPEEEDDYDDGELETTAEDEEWTVTLSQSGNHVEVLESAGGVIYVEPISPETDVAAEAYDVAYLASPARPEAVGEMWIPHDGSRSSQSSPGSVIEISSDDSDCSYPLPPKRRYEGRADPSAGHSGYYINAPHIVPYPISEDSSDGDTDGPRSSIVGHGSSRMMTYVASEDPSDDDTDISISTVEPDSAQTSFVSSVTAESAETSFVSSPDAESMDAASSSSEDDDD